MISSSFSSLLINPKREGSAKRIRGNNKKITTFFSNKNQRRNVMFTHENGPWHVDNGSMISNSIHCMLDEDISVCVSIDAIDKRLILHKVGKTSFIKEYYDTAVQRFIDIGLPEMANEWKLISFNVQYPEFNFTPEGYNFTIDEICTLINWWSNSPGASGSEILTMSINDVKNKLKMLSDIGF